MKAKVLLVAFLFVTFQSVYPDISIIVKNNTEPYKLIDVNVCVGNNNCTGWLVPSFNIYNDGVVQKIGLASKGYVTVKYRIRGHKKIGVLQLPEFLDQYNDEVVTLIIPDASGEVILRAPGGSYKLTVLGG